jgi:hypothetical protein
MHLSRWKKSAVIGTTAVVAAGLLTATIMGAQGASSAQRAGASGHVTHATLHALNNSGVTGNADVTVRHGRLEVDLHGHHLLKGVPHAEHIHFGRKAANECPTVADDSNADHRLNTAEGLAEYGPVRVSLTTSGDTSAKSTLAVDRYPTAPKGTIHYNRKGIKVSPRVARGIRQGKAVLVIHGIDYNGNGTYDFSAGESELDPSLPAEATDPVTCGVLKVVSHR